MIDFQTILLPINRGKFFDVLIFIFNLLAITVLSNITLHIFRFASNGDKFAQLTLGLMCLGLFFLMPLGASLKRWNYQKRRIDSGKITIKPKKKVSKKKVEDDDDEFRDGVRLVFLIMFGAVIFAIGLAAFLLLATFFFGDQDVSKLVVIIAFAVILAFTVFNTATVLKYFSPIEEPMFSFLKSETSEWLGDILLFVNMLIFQVVWAMILQTQLGKVSSFLELIARGIVFFLIALLFYFPPRILYLLEDITDKKTWLTMLLANSPTILRFLIGI
jgi:hypothetical protein